MRALTHPVRLALLEALNLEGQLTATQAGELIGEPPNTCSFHFRQLAKYGFVEEAGPAPGRSRPWRLTASRMHYSDLHEDADTAAAARELDRMLRERYLDRLAPQHRPVEAAGGIAPGGGSAVRLSCPAPQRHQQGPRMTVPGSCWR
jgi:predicted ArsR family transcriptional regulator